MKSAAISGMMRTEAFGISFALAPTSLPAPPCHDPMPTDLHLPVWLFHLRP